MIDFFRARIRCPKVVLAILLPYRCKKQPDEMEIVFLSTRILRHMRISGGFWLRSEGYPKSKLQASQADCVTEMNWVYLKKTKKKARNRGKRVRANYWKMIFHKTW